MLCAVLVTPKGATLRVVRVGQNYCLREERFYQFSPRRDADDADHADLGMDIEDRASPVGTVIVCNACGVIVAGATPSRLTCGCGGLWRLGSVSYDDRRIPSDHILITITHCEIGHVWKYGEHRKVCPHCQLPRERRQDIRVTFPVAPASATGLADEVTKQAFDDVKGVPIRELVIVCPTCEQIVNVQNTAVCEAEGHAWTLGHVLEGQPGTRIRLSIYRCKAGHAWPSGSALARCPHPGCGLPRLSKTPQQPVAFVPEQLDFDDIRRI